MASSSRKRAVDAAEEADEEPLIRQLSSARPVGCAMCWNPSRQTAQTAKKKPKMKTLKESPADEQPIGSNEFVYQTCGLDEDLRFSPDGRHMYTFTKDGSLLVVDLFHGKQKIFKSPKGRKGRGISYFVPLNPTTILLLSMAEGGRRDADYAELELLRLSEHRDVFEAALLERTKNAPFRTFIFAEIGGQTDVKGAVLGKHGTLHFCRLNVDEGRMETFHTAPTSHFARTNDFIEPPFACWRMFLCVRV
ncbi:hypothetical protein M3Y99_00850000 [Aphelenchoides fujianensis]|nr:hypothetical protein M3Y99_00850000 [Aphelenchoides fujianensis]